MQLVFGLIICILVCFISWFVGHIARKEFKLFEEEESVISNFIDLATGLSSILIIINLIGNITKSFDFGLIVAFLAILGIIGWRFAYFKEIIFSLKANIQNKVYINLVKQNTNRYFWILFGGVNFLYFITAFSTFKIGRFFPGNNHIFNVGQFLNDIYPLRYFLLPDITARTNYGPDIFAALISKISGAQAEISLDILTLTFLNLLFVLIYSLVLKFQNSNVINKYIVVFCSLIAWTPLLAIFNTKSSELPKGIINQWSYIAQNKLINVAGISGTQIHWFFDPALAMGSFYFIIAIYLLYQFFNKNQSLFSIIFLGVFISSFVIIDFTKFFVLLIGTAIYVIASNYPKKGKRFTVEKTLLKNLGIIFGGALLLGLIHRNCMILDKNYLSFNDLYKIGKSSFSGQVNPIEANLLLYAIYGYGFYLAFKQNLKWEVFISAYFISGILIPSFVSIPGGLPGKMIMSSNLIGAFAIPLTLDFIYKKYNFKHKQLIAFNSILFIVLGFSSIIFWAFGDSPTSIFNTSNGKIKFAGFQKIEKPVAVGEEQRFIEHLKFKHAKNSSLVTDPDYAPIFSSSCGLTVINPSFNPSDQLFGDLPVKGDSLKTTLTNFREVASLNTKIWIEKKINWIYLNQKLFKFYMTPEDRLVFLNTYLSKGAELSLSNNKNLDNSKELFKVNPKLINKSFGSDFGNKLKSALNDKKDSSVFIKEILRSPYYGIYSYKSNDFDGDKISDIAFYNSQSKIWTIIYGKDFSEEAIDIKKTLLNGDSSDDVYYPLPADYDGDSKTDIALFNRNSSTWHILRSSTASNQPPNVWCSGLDEIPIPADLEGDSKADLSCYNSTDRRWPTLLSSNSSYYTKSFNTNVSDISIYSDIDGDNKSDFIVYNPGIQSFSVYLAVDCKETPSGGFSCGGGGNVATKSIIVKVGKPTSRVVTSDYDGDGKIDLATWDPVDGSWEIAFAKNFLSASEGKTDVTYKLGLAGDIPMPGDYNGDGSSEIAVFHQDSGVFEIGSTPETKKTYNLSKHVGSIPASFIGI